MAVHLVVDGYNLIRRSPTLSGAEELSLEHGREALVEKLRQYKRIKGHRITVVFDGADKVTLAEEKTQQKGIKVIYSRRGKTADSVIRRICRDQGEKVVVVTADGELAKYAESCGSVVMPSEEFEAKIEMSFYANLKGLEGEDEGEGWSPVKGTSKKGPARRLSKKDRKRRKKWKKL
ncbi:MAG: NYN domain-containing protein [Deltaproteobacteria bacterium]|nr:MAG: NYN domain-containing protein [Deltaproteobacteria bacterium]